MGKHQRRNDRRGWPSPGRPSWRQQTFPRESKACGLISRGLWQGFPGSEGAVASPLPVHSGPALHPRLLLSHFFTLKMSFLEEKPGVKMGSEDCERDELQCHSEGKILIKIRTGAKE